MLDRYTMKHIIKILSVILTVQIKLVTYIGQRFGKDGTIHVLQDLLKSVVPDIDWNEIEQDNISDSSVLEKAEAPTAQYKLKS